MARINQAEDEERLVPDQAGRTLITSDTITFDSVIARLYLNPYLLYQEQSSRVPKNSELPPRVSNIRDIITENFENGPIGTEDVFESFHGGKLSLCGSVAEGTKVGGADEFDFQYLLPVNGLVVKSKRLLRTKPRSGDKNSLSFFSLHEIEADGVTGEIMASAIQERFLRKVEQALRQRPVSEDFEIKKAGPAVKISFKNDTGHTIKIDLTLGLRVVDSDPLGPYMSPFARKLAAEGRMLSHLVAANDYWKICFVDTEQRLLREIIETDEVKGAVYRIIKHLRDKADIKDPYGDGILPSYPIKVTFIDIAYQDHAKGIMWSMQDVTFHVIRILREVERRGLDHELCSLFIENEDVMGEGDRSYLESRRLLLELKAKESFYRLLRNKLFLFILSSFIFVCSVAIMATILIVIDRHTDGPSKVQLIIVNALFPVIFAIFCLDNLYLWVVKSERILKLYPSWPKFCFSSLLFQNIPLFIVSMLDHTSFASTILWQVFNIFTALLICACLLIVIGNSCRGLYRRKSYLIADVSILYCTIIRPYKWNAPSRQKIAYLPEIGDYTMTVKLTYIWAIILCSLIISMSMLISVLLIGVDMLWIPREIAIYQVLFGNHHNVRSACVVMTPFILILLVVILSIVSHFDQRRTLHQYAKTLI